MVNKWKWKNKIVWKIKAVCLTQFFYSLLKYSDFRSEQAADYVNIEATEETVPATICELQLT